MSVNQVDRRCQVSLYVDDTSRSIACTCTACTALMPQHAFHNPGPCSHHSCENTSSLQCDIPFASTCIPGATPISHMSSVWRPLNTPHHLYCTGVIGRRIKLQPLLDSVPKLVAKLGASAEDAHHAAVGITTTDLVSKSAAIEVITPLPPLQQECEQNTASVVSTWSADPRHQYLCLSRFGTADKGAFSEHL